MNSFVGEIIIVGFNFPPKGYAFCDGQIMSIAQNTALFSLLGTTYGGDGETTFALPDLRGRIPVQAGQGPGLSERELGSATGTENFTLKANQLPAHTHTLLARNATGDVRTPAGNALAIEAADQTAIYSSATPLTALHPNSIGVSGSGGATQPVSNMPPFLVFNFAISLQGIFPPRS